MPLELEGEVTVEGRSVDRVVGIEGVRSDVAMMRTPDGHGRLELIKYHTPPGRGGDPRAPANALGTGHVTFAVEGIDDVLDRLRAHGAGTAHALSRPSRHAHRVGPAVAGSALAVEVSDGQDDRTCIESAVPSRIRIWR